jgi:hypothetical protein
MTKPGDTIGLKDSARLTVKSHRYTGKRKLRHDQLVGDVPSQSTDTGWVNIRRTIDKNSDHYEEEVRDEAGNIIHHVSEPLSKHRGHGSAK